MNKLELCVTIGAFVLNKYRARDDVQAAARALRKQGYPLWVARLILLGRI